MKIASRDAARLCAAPPETWSGILLYGSDAGLVMDRRRQIVGALRDRDGSDLQVTQIPAGDARRAPADVEAALTTRGFFSGRPIVLVEDATDGLAAALEPVLAALTTDDGVLVLTADHLPARSKLRKLFETGASLAAIALYPQTLGAREIEEELAARGVRNLTPSALAAIVAVAADMDHGTFRQFLDIIEIFALDRSEPVDIDDVRRLAPVGLEGDLDAFTLMIADGHSAEVGPLLRRLSAAGAAPVGILIALQRHFKALLTAKTASGGLTALRPPPLGPRRDRIQHQVRIWDLNRLEQANRLLFETDGRIRSAAAPPALALLERAALRLALMASR